MLIYIYSKTSGRVGSGGGKSTFTTAKYLNLNNHKTYTLTSISALESSIKKEKPNLILHHNITDMIKIYKICKKYNIPLIVTVNNLISCTSGTHIIQDNKFGKPYLKSNFYKSFLALYHEKYVRPFNEKLFAYITLPYRYYLMNKRIEVLNKAAGVIAISHTLKKLLEINGVKKKIYVCPQPIDNLFLVDPNIKRKEKKILFVGGGEPFKGIYVLIEAFKKLNRKDINLLIAGEIRKAHKISIKKYPKNIKFLGQLKEEELKKLYYKSTFLVFPNLWFEAFGRGWAEALTCGCPVLAFRNRGGPADYLEHNKNTYLLNENMEELKKGLYVMIKDKKLREKLSKNGREFAKNNLIASVVVRKLIKIYEENI